MTDQRSTPQAERDRQVGRLTTINRGAAIAAAVGVVGLGAIAALSYPGASTATADDPTLAPGGGAGATGAPTQAQAPTATQAPGAPAATPVPTRAPAAAAPAAPFQPPTTSRRRGRSNSGGS